MTADPREETRSVITHCTFHLDADNEPSVLPRVLLAFSRRRLRIQALHFLHLDESRPAEIQIDLDCAPALAADVAKQLRRVVEVHEVSLVVTERSDAPAPRPAPAAA